MLSDLAGTSMDVVVKSSDFVSFEDNFTLDIYSINV